MKILLNIFHSTFNTWSTFKKKMTTHFGCFSHYLSPSGGWMNSGFRHKMAKSIDTSFLPHCDDGQGKYFLCRRHHRHQRAAADRLRWNDPWRSKTEQGQQERRQRRRCQISSKSLNCAAGNINRAVWGDLGHRIIWNAICFAPYRFQFPENFPLKSEQSNLFKFQILLNSDDLLIFYRFFSRTFLSFSFGFWTFRINRRIQRPLKYFLHKF